MVKVLGTEEAKILDQVFSGEISITKAAKILNISRNTIYKWIKNKHDRSRIKRSIEIHDLLPIIAAYPKLGPSKLKNELAKRDIKVCTTCVWNKIKKHGLAKKSQRLDYSYKVKLPKHVNKISSKGKIKLTNEIRKRAVEDRLLLNLKTKDITDKYFISRKTLYKWIKRYKKGSIERNNLLDVMKDNNLTGSLHPKSLSENVINAVLTQVIENPQLSTHSIAKKMDSVSNHGVQNILKKYGLNLYKDRVTYSNQNKAGVIATKPNKISDRIKLVWDQFTPNVAPAPPPSNLSNLFRFFKTFLVSSLIAAIFSFGIFNWISLLGASGSISTAVGMVFATIAFLSGTFFFIYSLKYYLTIAIVLSYSQTDLFKESDKVGRKKGLFNWILGLGNGKKGGEYEDGHGGEVFGSDNKSMRSSAPVGLEPNLEHVILKRFPFISVHIPFYNEKNVVGRAIKAATSFDYPGDYEVILCDDSTDETTQIIRDYMHESGSANNKTSPSTIKNEKEGWELASVKVRPGVTLKHLHRTTRSGFKGGALKIALTLVDPVTEFVSIFDADFVPYPDTLELFMKYFQAQAGTLEFKGNSDYQYNTNTNLRRLTDTDDSGVSGNTTNNQSQTYAQTQTTTVKSAIAAVCGYQWHVLNKSENWITRGVRTEYAGSYVIERSGQEILGAFKQIHGSVYAIRRDVLEEVGWDTSITEDFELTLKLYDAGYKVVYTPYIQAPAECVSTLKRLIRQRMRWAEGHSFNVKKMWRRLLFGKWVEGDTQLATSVSMKFGVGSSSKRFIPSPLTPMEKLEFIYLSPYYLQAFFFLLGTFSWLISETIFRVHLPFWTELWGWSLVLTNMISLPLMNAVGMFLEESEERDYLGLGSFVVLSYLVVPFQAYASVKGFLEDHEGPWFRTPKTGRITDVFTRGRFYRFISGIMPGKVQTVPTTSQSLAKYLSLATANNRFDEFKINTKGKIFGKAGLSLVVSLTMLVFSFAPFIDVKDSQASTTKAVSIKDAQKKQQEVDAEDVKNEKIEGQLISQFASGTPNEIDYIFHPEPRLRIKNKKGEIEMELKSLSGEKIVNNDSYREDGIYKYNIGSSGDDLELIYTPSYDSLKEELILKSYKQIKSVDYNINLSGLELAVHDGVVYFAPKGGGENVFRFEKPFMFEKDHPENRMDIEFEAEKDGRDYKLKKIIGTDAQKWLADPARNYPVVIDPTLVQSVIQTTIVTAETNYQQQKKIIWANGALNGDAWYAFYNDGTNVIYEKCVPSVDGCETGTDWTDATDIDGGDADNRNPSVWWENDQKKIWVTWGDNTADNVEFLYVDVDASDPGTLGALCSGPDQTNITTASWFTSIAVADSGGATDDVFITFVDTSTSTVNNIYRIDVTTLDTSTCTVAWNSILANSGVDAGDYPSAVAIGDDLHLIFQDGTTIMHSVSNNDGGTEWDRADYDITAADTDNTSIEYEVATDGTDIWLFIDKPSGNGTELWQCASCSSSTTWSALTAPFTAENDANLAIGYAANTDSIYVFANKGATFDVTVRSSPVSSISWSADFNLGTFGASTVIANLSAVSNSSSDDGIAIVLNESANQEFEFSTVPENWLYFMFVLPVIYFLKNKRKRSKIKIRN